MAMVVPLDPIGTLLHSIGSTKDLPDPWVPRGTCLPHRSSASMVGAMGGAGEQVLFGDMF